MSTWPFKNTWIGTLASNEICGLLGFACRFVAAGDQRIVFQILFGYQFGQAAQVSAAETYWRNGTIPWDLVDEDGALLAKMVVMKILWGRTDKQTHILTTVPKKPTMMMSLNCMNIWCSSRWTKRRQAIAVSTAMLLSFFKPKGQNRIRWSKDYLRFAWGLVDCR